MDRRVIFMGTPDFAVSALKAIIAAGYNVVGVYSQPPRAAGRGMQLQKSPVQQIAEAANIPTFTPLNFKEDADIQAFKDLKPDVAVVAAYGLLLPQVILDIPKYGCINIHASLLPRWRGAAPIQRAIMAGDKVTGITIMQMDAGLDTGDMLAKAELAIAEMNTQALHDKLSALGADLIINTLNDLDNLKPVPQPIEGVTYAKKIAKEEGLIDWQDSATVIAAKIRAINCWFDFKGKRVRILSAAVVDKAPAGSLIAKCGQGMIELLLLQPEGKKPMSGADFMNGYQCSVIN